MLKKPKLTVLCQINEGCMGCCGHGYSSNESILNAIEENTEEFSRSECRHEHEFISFRDRKDKDDLRDGVCRNLIRKEGKLLCPLHPALHDGNDMRKGHCDINYLCKTAKMFERWKSDKQEKFISFITGKKLDKITLSLMLDGGLLLDEFTNREKENVVEL